MEALQISPITAAQIKSWTSRDPVISKVWDKVLQGWVDTKDPNLQPYQCCKLELSIEDGCVLRGNRVVIPPPGRAKVLDTLHEGHPGMARMKSLAQYYVWWPSMEQELEQKVKVCQLSGDAEFTSSSTSTSMGMATMSMGQTPY